MFVGDSLGTKVSTYQVAFIQDPSSPHGRRPSHCTAQGCGWRSAHVPVVAKGAEDPKKSRGAMGKDLKSSP